MRRRVRAPPSTRSATASRRNCLSPSTLCNRRRSCCRLSPASVWVQSSTRPRSVIASVMGTKTTRTRKKCPRTRLVDSRRSTSSGSAGHDGHRFVTHRSGVECASAVPSQNQSSALPAAEQYADSRDHDQRHKNDDDVRPVRGRCHGFAFFGHCISECTAYAWREPSPEVCNSCRYPLRPAGKEIIES